MIIGNRINMTITSARMTRVAKSRVLTGGGQHNSSGLMSVYGDSSLADSLGQGNKAALAQKLARNQKKSYDYGIAGKSAERVGGRLDKLLATGDTSIFGQSDQEKAKGEAADEIEAMAADYNLMLGKLNGSGEASDTAFARKLKETMSAHTASLKNIGITQDSNGLLAVDTETLKAADIEDLKKLFGPESSLGTKLSKLAGQIQEYADRQAEELEKSSYQASLNYTRYGTDSVWGSGGSWYNAQG